MVRRSAGFIAKKAHRKSRGGCLTCKRKKVKCDEAQPSCGYCTLRKLNCEYPQERRSESTPASTNSQSSLESSPEPKNAEPEVDFNDANCAITSWLTPATQSAIGQLTFEELDLLNHYKTSTWKTFAIRGDLNTHDIHRDLVPRMSISHSHLLYALLSLAATYRNRIRPSKESANQALLYRTKTFAAYTKELQNITNDNYEAIVVTGTFLLALVNAPSLEAPDEEHLDWLYTLLKMSEGIRILASLRWGQGIEKLSIYPLICRELRTLPPPPIIVTPDKPPLQTPPGPLGGTPDHPNPASTYNLPFIMPFGSFVFLPPPLMALLERTINPPASGPIDLNRNALVPVFYALSPIFLSLYYYHLNPDFNVRAFVFTSFLMPEFLALVKARETRALVLLTWWFALAALVPAGWWGGKRAGVVVDALVRLVEQRGDERVAATLDGAVKLVRLFEEWGSEAAAASIFDDWEGVDWDDGPRKAEEWEAGMLVDLCEQVTFEGPDIDLYSPA
ncbi:hypothetical protein BKA63DRAFT_115666 [Paraphoma chrysanthemicola]|nr:hypothetical protein BKA63DRAFT_115666 [Paraphoma chrysanthemicola]